ncbi:DNA polymerase III subunit delta' [Fulvivirga sp. RKSG066]|uniref:DNA polymerase III subunit n=1 Tax=Fulvivirga aurantia TaxID=2529383 RepID=UPI0012BCAD5B|nr:DNA polymerase III subunit delta [Fulvivirga aurantia]MTI23012.1 DNA polymerase III subunit delta' [Fulvivirga aurantia]
MLFSKIHGLDEVKTRLVNAAKNDQVAHAQLFLGKPGSPNLAMALAYAAFLNCENRTEEGACGSCPSCLKNQKYVHPDVHFVFPVSSTKKVTGKDVVSNSFLKEWRQFLIENPYGDLNTWSGYYGGEDKQVNISKEESRQIIKNLSLKAFEGKYKVMIVWLPEFMHPSAANGILKILEEPPESTIFLLVSNDSERLLTTILSRTQIVNIPMFADEDIRNILTNSHGIDAGKAEEVAHLADGDISKAFRLSNNLEDDNQQIFADWMRDCFKRDFASLVKRADTYHGMNKLAQKSLLQFTLNILRETLVYIPAREVARTGGKINEFVDKFSKVMDANKIEKIAKLVNEAHYHIERNASPKMTFLDLSLQIARIIK